MGPGAGRFGYTVIEDKLAGFADLLRWAEVSGLIEAAGAQGMARRAGRNARAAKAVFARAIELREAIYRLCIARVRGWDAPLADLTLLNRELAACRAHRRLAACGTGFEWAWDEPEAPGRIVWALAESAAAFLVSPAIAGLRECPGEDCGWLFLDTSRNRSRRWCEMAVCGNRAKLRRLRRRVRDGTQD